MNKNDLVMIRDYQAGDKNLIMSTWLKGLRYGNEWFEAINSKVYYTLYHAMLEALLAHPNTVVKVACLKDDPDVILAYVVHSKDNRVLHWVFCKKAWRGIKIAKSLLPVEIKVVTHLTSVGKSYLKSHSGLIFNPFYAP